MRRWVRVGLAATTTLAGMVALAPAPAAHAAGGTAFSIPKAGRTKATPKATRTPATNPFAMLPPELLTCIAAQAGPVDQINFNQVCRQWHAAAHQPPVSIHDITVVRTKTQLKAALNNAQASAIVIIPDEYMVIGKAPVNPQTHIAIHDTKTSHQFMVTVRADIHVTATGTAAVNADGPARVTATDSVTVSASGSAQVTASDATRVAVYGSAQVTASDTARVAVFSTSADVFVRSSSVRLWGTSATCAAVRSDVGVNPTFTTLAGKKLDHLTWDDITRSTR